jgi:hypothetical protein
MPPDLRDLADRIERLAAEHPAGPKAFWILNQCAIDVRAVADSLDRQADAACGSPRPPPAPLAGARGRPRRRYP